VCDELDPDMLYGIPRHHALAMIPKWVPGLKSLLFAG
jgi:hypothetical protein